MKTIKCVYASLCLTLLFGSCSREVISSAHRDLPEHGWAITDTVWLTIDVPDTMQHYDVALTLRHTDDYRYQNLWLFVCTQDSSLHSTTDTVMACMADDRGRWLGTRAGRYYTGYVTMGHDILFPTAGTYTFGIVHGMRDSVITGIADVGVEIKQPQP